MVTPRTSVSIEQFIRVVRLLPSDKPVLDTQKWYTTQKQHWLGWLGEYHGAGAYGRKLGKSRDAEFAYNHIVEPKMLLWLINAAGVKPGLIRAAQQASSRASTLPSKSASIRKLVPWSEVV